MDDFSRNRPIDTRTFSRSADCLRYGSDRLIPEDWMIQSEKMTIAYSIYPDDFSISYE